VHTVQPDVELVTWHMALTHVRGLMRYWRCNYASSKIANANQRNAMRLPRTVHNWTSYVGAAISALAVLVFVFLVLLNAFEGAQRTPYAGLVIFILVPAALIFGLILIPVGMFFESRRWKRTATRTIPSFPVINLNDASVRNAVFVFAAGSVVLLFLSAFGSYQAYEYTDSVTFCGMLCHSVMAPEYTTYSHSPHARVQCVECHVGPGASWYVRSKLSGAYQVYAVLFHKYPSPIPTPIENLRPAQQTCEQCHWPEQFYGGQQKRLIHFLPDENNTRWEINLLIRTGGGSPVTGRTEGIHWHMNIASRVEYIATDETRQKIPWVRITDLRTGKSTEYTSAEGPAAKDLVGARIRTMDCMDCHDRPSHIFRSPSYSMNLALASGRIDPGLPFIKSKGVELLAAKYESTDSALETIDSRIREFYRKEYPGLEKTKKPSISGAVAAIQEIYRGNYFPHMKARWDTHADNIGHLNFPGCYRCHDRLHRSKDGKTITESCNSCHTILSQGGPGDMTYSTAPEGLAFQHPEDIGGAWKEMKCSDCHTGQTP